MSDIEDFAEAVFDIEHIVEEVTDPEDLVEDFVANPLMILFALTAALAGLLLMLLFLITLVLLVLAFGPVEVLVLLMALCFIALVGSITAFLYVRTDIPSDVYRKIDDALKQANDSPAEDRSMTQKEAIEELKDQYATGNLDEHELDQALDDALTSENPQEVVKRYSATDLEQELEG